MVSQQKEAEISELKVKIDELKVTSGRDAKSREELQLHYQQRLREKHAELEHYRRSDAAVSSSFSLVFCLVWALAAVVFVRAISWPHVIRGD